MEFGICTLQKDGLPQTTKPAIDHENEMEFWTNLITGQTKNILQMIIKYRYQFQCFKSETFPSERSMASKLTVNVFYAGQEPE